MNTEIRNRSLLLTAAMALATCQIIISCTGNNTSASSGQVGIQADEARPLIIELTDGGESIKVDGDASIEDTLRLEPGRLVIIKAGSEVPMGYITDIREKLRNSEGIRMKYQLNGYEPKDWEDYEFPLITTKENENGTYTYEVDRENTATIRINAAGSLLVGDGEAPYGIIIKPGEDLTPSMEIFANSIRDNHKVTFFMMKDRATRFGIFHEIVCLLEEAYGKVRNEYSISLFGKPQHELSEEEYQKIATEIPKRINMAKDKGTYRDINAR